MTDLLPCPHCGGKAELHTNQIAEDVMEAFVMCSTCFATTDDFEDACAPTAEAIAAWNRRSSPTREQVTEAKPLDDSSLRAKIGALGNELHNVATEHQNDEELATCLGSIVSRLWDISALASPSPTGGETGAVAVKPLEWDPFRAETPFGYYHIDDQTDRSDNELEGRPPFLLTGSRIDLSRHPTLEAARAAAQADYERRIRSALTHPAPLMDEVEAVQWRDMDSAPKGVDILVGGDLGHGWKSHVYRIRDEFWREDWEDEPTHWMPLPSAPALTKLQEGGR